MVGELEEDPLFLDLIEESVLSEDRMTGGDVVDMFMRSLSLSKDPSNVCPVHDEVG